VNAELRRPLDYAIPETWTLYVVAVDESLDEYSFLYLTGKTGYWLVRALWCSHLFHSVPRSGLVSAVSTWRGMTTGHISPRSTFDFRQKQESVLFVLCALSMGPPLWYIVHTSWLLTHRSRVRFPALPHFLCSGGSGTRSTQFFSG
jgi:hypothetical protein